LIARWWPLIGLTAMVLLGWAVRGGPIPVDDWFQQAGHDMGSYRDVFLVFSKPPLVAVAWAAGIVVAVRQHRRRLAIAMAVTPLLTFAMMRACKHIFRREKEGALAYPSGHTTFLVTVAGLLVLLAGVGMWAVIVAVCVCLLGMLGLSITFHYFTDTIGGALLATSAVCLVAWLARDEPSGQVSSASADLR
jgi:membrane-associated phospholipid phosphatase